MDRKLLLQGAIFISLVTGFSPVANATVYEFGKDGSVVEHVAIDYLSEARRKKKPYVPARTINNHDYDDLVTKASEKYGVAEHIIHAVIAVESSYDSAAISPVGAEGLMQLMPKTAARYRVKDSFNPKDNIDGGTRYLRDLLKMFDGDLRLALAAYNAGEGAVQKYNGVPPYSETIEYIRKMESLLGKPLG